MPSPGPQPRVTLEDVLTVLAEPDKAGTPLTAAEIAEEVDCARRTAHRKLAELADRGDIETKKVGARSRVWWLPSTAVRGQTAGVVQDQFGKFISAVDEYAIFVLDADGRVASWNEGAARIKGYERAEILGEHFSTFYPDSDIEQGVPAKNLEAATRRGSLETEGRRIRADGTAFWAEVVITAITDADGTLKGFTKVTRDCTERKRRQEELRRERDQTEELLETAPVAIAIQDADGTIRRTNQRAQALLGESESRLEHATEGATDWSLYDAAGDPMAIEETPTSRVRETGEPVFDEIVGIEPPGEDRLWVSVNATPIFDTDGELDRIVVAGEDITQLKTQRDRHRRHRESLAAELEHVFDRVSDAFYALDEQWRFTYINERAESLLRLSPAKALGEPVWAGVPDAVEEKVRAEFEDAMATQDPVSFDLYLEEQEDYFEVRAYPSDDGLSVYHRDITARIERERRLMESRQRYRTLVEQFPNGAVTMYTDTPEGIQYTIAGGEILGDRRKAGEALEGSLVTDTVPDTLASELLPAFNAALAGETRSFEAEYEGRVYQFRTAPVRDEDGEVFAGVAMSYDDTDRVEREQALERFRAIVETVNDGVYTVDKSGTITQVNERYAEMVGYPREAVVGMDASALVADEIASDAQELERELVEESRDSATLEAELETATGETIVAQATFSILPGPDEAYERVAVVRDITERKEYERELERYETLIEESTDVNAIVDENGEFEYITPSSAYVLGYEPAELHGENAFEYLHPDDQSETFRQLEALAEAAGDRRTVEFRFQHADGSWIWLEARGRNLQEDSLIDGIVVYTRDITDRKQYEEQIESRARQQQVVSELGRTALEGQDLDDLFATATRRVAATLDLEYCKVLDLDAEADELTLRAGVGWRDGVVGAATVSARETDSQASYTLETEEPVVVTDMEAESRFSGPELLTAHDVQSGISTIIGSRDAPWGILGTHDTERTEFSEQDVVFVRNVANVLGAAIERREYRAELENLVDRLEESNERLERFAYVASHDLQEPLRMVSSYVQLLERRYADELDEDAEEFIEYAVDGAERMGEMIDGLLEYSRVDTEAEPFEAVDAEAAVERVTADLSFMLEENDARVAVGDLPTVQADSKQLEQVFQNLVSNAVKYSGDEPPEIEIGAERRQGSWVFSVSDQGIGMDPAETDQIFNIFDRLHAADEHEGTGIGLALCQKIVERHDGDIWVETAPGDGTTVYFSLPMEPSTPSPVDRLVTRTAEDTAEPGGDR